MNEKTVTIPRHLKILGGEAIHLTAMLNQCLSMAIIPSCEIWLFRGYILKRLDRLSGLILCFEKYVNSVGQLGMTSGGKLSEWRMTYALWRLRSTLRVMLHEREKLHRVKATENRQRIAGLIAEFYDHSFSNMSATFSDIAETISDPLAAAKRKGVQPDGDRLLFAIELVFPQPDIGELMCRIHAEYGQEISDQATSRSARKPISTAEVLLAGLLLSWLFGEIFEDHDKDS